MQSLPKSLFLFVVCLPLALVLGFLLATPQDNTTVLVVGSSMLLLLIPFMLKGHHSMLILSWNAFVNAFFLPGKPYLWMLMTVISFFFLVLTKTLNRSQMKLIWVPWVAWPLIAIGVITYVTSELTGGVGIRGLGSDVYGGKKYIFIWMAIAGYFAISSTPIDPSKRNFLAAGFYISGVTAIVSNIAYELGENFYFLFLLFPAEWAIAQAGSEIIGGFTRVSGLSPASLALLSFLLLRFGIRGIFDVRRPWRILMLIAAVAAGLFSGFRAVIVLSAMFVVLQFFVEGLHKTKYLAVALAFAGILAAVVLPFANRLPISVQRCLTVLPLDLDAAAEDNARGSTEWRLEIWKSVAPDIPKYLWLGKGYALDPKDIYFAQLHAIRGVDAGYESAIVAGDYHSGPLTLIIPFGVPGVVAFLAFLVGSIRVLWRNFKFGDPAILNINRFNLVAFVIYAIHFFAIFGTFYIDLAKFVGIVGLSIALNHGVASPVKVPVAVEPSPEPEPDVPIGGRLAPAFRGGLRA